MFDKEEIAKIALSFLNSSPTGVLATVSAAGHPHTSTIYFAFDDDFSIYFIVSHHSQKFTNMTMNPLASFTVGTGPAYQEITLQGKVEIFQDPHQRESMTARIAERVTSPMREWPIFRVGSLENGGTALFKLTPTHVQYLNLKLLDDPDDYNKYIYQLLP